MSKSSVIVTGWYLEYRQGTSNKFYTVLIADNGVVITNWGRIGSEGQGKIDKMPNFEAADDVGRRQLYAKKSKGYEALATEVKFPVEEVVLNESCSRDRWNVIARLFAKARTEPQFEGDKQAVATHYQEFVKRASKLLDTASTRSFDEVWAEGEELQEAWKELEDQHGQAKVTVDLLTQTLNQRLMSGSL